MKNGMLVFDSVVHSLDYTDRPAEAGREKEVGLVRKGVGGFAELTAQRGPAINPDFAEPPTHEYANDVLFNQSVTDYAVAQTVPLFHSWKGGLGPAELNWQLSQSNPGRIFFAGGVDPLHFGLSGALEEMDRQVEEWGAISFKFYQAQSVHHHWSAEDEEVAYPMFERAEKLGIKLLQFHKGFPLERQRVEDLRPNDLQRPAADFPNLNFGIHHYGDPYVDETINIAGRFDNVYLIMPVWFNHYFLQPKEMMHRLGKTLLLAGNDSLCYGSEAFTWPSVQTYIDLWAELEMPDELQSDYGYPEIDEETRANVFGLNFVRALGWEPERLTDGLKA